MSCKSLIVALEWIMERVEQRRQITADTTFLFADFKGDWKLWWHYASPEQRAEIAACGRSKEAQHAFAKEIDGWTRQHWPQHPQASDALVFQLLNLEPFSTWSELQQKFSDPEYPSAYGVAIPGKDRGGREHVWRLFAWLAPKLAGEPKNVAAIPINFETHDSSARHAPGEAIKAIQSTLTWFAGRRFLRWYFQYVWQHSRLERTLVLSTFSLNLLLLTLLSVLPDRFLKNDLPVALGIEILIVSAVVTFATFAVSLLRELRRAAKDAEAWLRILRHSRVLMAISSPSQPPIKGASFSITLAVSLLLALDKSSPAQSSFFRNAFSQLRARAGEWLFTGCLNSDGTFGAVDYVVAKLRAAIAFNEDAALPLKVFVQPKERAVEEVRETTEASFFPATQEYVHAGSSTYSPELRRYASLRDLLFDAGPRTQCIPGIMLLIATICFAGLALRTGLVDLPRFINPPLAPRASMTLSLGDVESRASVTIFTAAADQFAGRVRSDYWQSCALRRFPAADDLEHAATIGFSLTKSPSASTSRASQGTVEIIRLRHVLWRTLPPVEKVSVATFDDLINTGPPSR